VKTYCTAFVSVAVLAAACSPSPQAPPNATYSPKTGRLETLAADANGNGRIDTVSYMDGTRILRIELDLDENGQVERWDFYGEDGELEKVGFSRLNDGVMDAQAFYAPADVLARMEISTRRDGTFDRTEFYEDGALVRSADDTDGDGRPDKWDEYMHVAAGSPEDAGYAVTSTAFDDSGTGRPNRRFVYGPGGSIDRVELDPDGDGVFVGARAASGLSVRR
jgi:hypothetical protein